MQAAPAGLTLTVGAFAAKYGWKNDPELAIPLTARDETFMVTT